MPRTLWTRRPSLDNPRPAGRRRWARLRRGGAFARRVLWVSHGRRGTDRVPREHPGTQRRITRVIPPLGGEPPTAGRLTSGADGIGAGAGTSRRRGTRSLATSGARAAGGSAAAEGTDPHDADEPGRLLPGAPSRGRQLRFLIVNLCTLTSLGLGVLAIVLATSGDPRNAALALLACVACDGMDGMLARRLGVASSFGAQLDSLADMCAFGIAAPVLVYVMVAESVPTPAAVLTCALVAGCAAVRLARFNVSPHDGRYFTGVPTTLAAGVMALAVLLELPLPPVGWLIGAVLLAITMVTSFPYAKLGSLLRLPPWVWLAPLAAALVEVRLMFVVLVLAYLGSGPLLWWHRRHRLAPAASLDPAPGP